VGQPPAPASSSASKASKTLKAAAKQRLRSPLASSLAFAGPEVKEGHGCVHG